MDKIKRDRPAFPTSIEHAEGMTLRDYFAAKALAGMATSMCYTDKDFSNEAAACYRIADAMLKAREAR